MKDFTYNDMDFTMEKSGKGWTIARRLPDRTVALVGAGLFADMPDNDAATRAQALVRTIYPVGIKIVGPDVAHPNKVGDLKIVGPDVSHPNFIYWDRDSTSFAM